MCSLRKAWFDLFLTFNYVNKSTLYVEINKCHFHADKKITAFQVFQESCVLGYSVLTYHCLDETLVGSESNSCLNENAQPEKVVPKSIAATSSLEQEDPPL